MKLTHRKERTARLNFCAEKGGEEGAKTSFCGVAPGGGALRGVAVEWLMKNSPLGLEGLVARGGFLIMIGTCFRFMPVLLSSVRNRIQLFFKNTNQDPDPDPDPRLNNLTAEDGSRSRYM